MKSMWKNIWAQKEAFLLATLFFLTPSNLFFKFAERQAYVHGLLSDYLLPKLYLSDVVILVLLGLWGWQFFTRRKSLRWNGFFAALILVTLALLGRQFFVLKPVAALAFSGRLVFWGIFATGLVYKRQLLHTTVFGWGVAITVLFQSLVGLVQFLTQSSVFHTYLALGEPALSNYAGIARGTFQHVEKILPYGTTAHPNILGGFLAASMLLLVYLWRKKTVPFLTLCLSLGVGVVTLYLTQSLAAWIAFGIGGMLFLVPHLQEYFRKLPSIIILILFLSSPLFIQLLAARYPESPSLTRRATLNTAAKMMIIDHPLIGVGLNNFTPNVEAYLQKTEVVRFIQPVHNVPLLWLSETGILGVLFLITIGAWIRTSVTVKLSREGKVLLWVLLPLAFFDHYLLTQQTGLLLTAFILTTSLQEK